MSQFKIFIFAFALVAVNVTFSRQIIKRYSMNTVEVDKRKYHVAQIIPPGKYKVIIWDKLLRTELWNSALFDHLKSKPNRWEFVFAYDPNSFNDYAKYFLHFHKIETNEKGQFLMRKNARIVNWTMAKRYYNFVMTPMNGTSLIPPDGTGMFVWQKIYARKITEPVDSVCHSFDGIRCLINYFEPIYEWKRFIRLSLNTFWLAASWFFGSLSENINFFLIATFRHLLNEAKEKKDSGGEMEEQNAKMLGIFWNAFAGAYKKEILLRRIRMADGQIIGLIDEFCQIDRSFLMGHNKLIATIEHGNVFFCQKWTELRQNLSVITQNAVVMKAFDKLLFDWSKVSLIEEKIILFWLKMFSEWLTMERDERSNGNSPWNAGGGPWLPLDLSLFRQIGELFVKGAFKSAKMEQIRDDNRKTLGTICARTNGAQFEFIRNNGQQSIAILNLWRTFCAKCHFLVSRTDATKNGNEDNVENMEQSHSVDANRCVICLSDERQIAFIPCKHLCVCEQCAQNIVIEKSNGSPKCPICRMSVEGTIRIYNP